MTDQIEATRQADWILPPAISAAGSCNTVNLALTTTPVIIDMTSIPSPPGLQDPPLNVTNQGPLGHYICMQAQGADTYFMFAPSYGALQTGAVAGGSIVGYGSGYVVAPTAVTITGGAGSGATATATWNTNTGNLASFTITAAGSGYGSAPTIAFTGGSYTGAVASITALLGTTPSASQANSVAANGSITMNAAVTPWIPQGQTASFKLPIGSPRTPLSANSPWRYLALLVASGSGNCRVWQSST